MFVTVVMEGADHFRLAARQIVFDVRRMEFQLTSGERVIWRGAPQKGLKFQSQDWFSIPFAAVWLGLVSSFFFKARNDSKPDDPGVYFVLPFFLVIGIYMLGGRYIIDMLVRGGTEYALTNQRAIIESGLFRRSTRSFSLAAAPEISFNEGRNGRGTIEFGNASPFYAVQRNWAGGSRLSSPAFENIDNASSVFAQVLNAQREAQSAR